MTDNVIVACKLPHGLILEVGKRKVELKGSMQIGRQSTSFFMPAAQMVGLTQVPRDFWEAWVRDHAEFAPYKKGLVFASDKKRKALDEAKEKAGLVHGLEPIDPSRMPNGLEQLKAGQDI